jgi:glycosyltransferase involved in cell wall biosynthesis
MSQNHEYSVVIPVRNGAEFITTCLESVLKQSLPATKIVVVNDHSTDETSLIVSQNFPDIQLINSSNNGQAAAIKHGLKIVKTKFVAFLDADDIWEPTKQENQIYHLVKNPGLSAVCSGVRNFLNNPMDKQDVNLNAKLFHESRLFPACTFPVEVFASDLQISVEVGHFQWLLDWWSHFERGGHKYLQTHQIHLNRRIHENNGWSLDFEKGSSQVISFLRDRKKNQG